MNNDQILDEIARQIRILMPGLDETVRMDTVFEELGMDSLTRVDLLSAAEMSFGIECPTRRWARWCGSRTSWTS